jgi:hypothetical protein
MSGFVIWILQWVALSGWLMAILALTPLFLSLGVQYESQTLLDWGTWTQSAWGIFTVTVSQAAVALLLLVSGFRNYVRAQRFLMTATLLSFGIIVILFLLTSTSEFESKINAYAAAVQGSDGFYDFLLNDVSSAGFNVAVGFTFLGTLLIAPIAWTSLQWATYSVEQGERSRLRTRSDSRSSSWWARRSSSASCSRSSRSSRRTRWEASGCGPQARRTTAVCRPRVTARV